jgi:hypothetical protein
LLQLGGDGHGGLIKKVEHRSVPFGVSGTHPATVTARVLVAHDAAPWLALTEWPLY